jgi:hypothetical protein
MKLRRLLAIPFVLLILPAAADAATFCVGPVGCPVAGIPKPGNAAGLQSALDDAELNSQPDHVLIAAGTYVASTASGFTYADAEELDVTGSGRGSTIVQGSAAPSSIAFSWNASGQASVLANLTVRMGAGSGGIGRGLSLQNARADGVSVDAAPGAANPATGVEMHGNAVFEGSSVESAPAFFYGIDAIGATNTVRASEVSAPVAVLAASNGAEIDVSRCRVTTTLEGVAVGGTGATSDVTNSLIRVIDSGTQEDGLRAYSGGAMVASNVTLIGSGGPTAGAVAEQGGAGSASLEVNSAVVRGFVNSFRAVQGPGSAVATLNWSSWDSPYIESGGANVNEGGGNLVPGALPGFVDAGAGDYRLRFDSPLVDAGAPGLGIGLDLAGAPRFIDGAAPFTGPRRDIGAHEYQREDPIAVASGPATGGVGQPLAFTAQGSSDADPGEALTYLWSFDDGTTATGTTATHAWSAPGPHTATVTVSDPTGQSDSAAVALQVAAEGADDGGGPADTVAPRLTDARMPRKRFRVGARTTARGAARAGSAFLFSLSEGATVRIRIERAAAGRRSAGRCVRPRRRLAQARRCRRYVLVGTLTRRELDAGRHRVAFSGRLGKRRLAAGRYRALLSATDAAGNQGRPARLAFRIVRR